MTVYCRCVCSSPGGSLLDNIWSCPVAAESNASPSCQSDRNSTSYGSYQRCFMHEVFTDRPIGHYILQILSGAQVISENSFFRCCEMLHKVEGANFWFRRPLYIKELQKLVHISCRCLLIPAWHTRHSAVVGNSGVQWALLTDGRIHVGTWRGNIFACFRLNI